MAEVVSKLGLAKEKGYLYFLRGSDVWKVPAKRAGESSPKGKQEKVAPGNFTREEGYLYFVDGKGNVARSMRAVGGQKRKKTKRTAAKKATKKPKKVAKKAKKAVKAKPKAKAKKR
jgi:hypothetical protein